MNDNPNSSRRTFLKGAAAVAGSLALPAVHAAGTGIIRAGVIGCGGRGEAAAMNAMNAGPDTSWRWATSCSTAFRRSAPR